MRPDPSYDPAVQPVEEFSDVSPFVIVTPTPQNRIQFFDQFPYWVRSCAPSCLQSSAGAREKPCGRSEWDNQTGLCCSWKATITAASPKRGIGSLISNTGTCLGKR